ncbi:MAG: hypothetical protein ABSG32_31230 [Terriglobia bacterium]|jgi:hypothetical protein
MRMNTPINSGAQNTNAEGFMPFPLKDSEAPEDCLLDAEDVATWLKVSVDWVWDHSARRAPYLPAIWLSDGALRFRRRKIAEFIDERARLSFKRRRRS